LSPSLAPAPEAPRPARRSRSTRGRTFVASNGHSANPSYPRLSRVAKVVGCPLSGSPDQPGYGRYGSIADFQLRGRECPVRRRSGLKRTGRFREEFRTPLGVRKSPIREEFRTPLGVRKSPK